MSLTVEQAVSLATEHQWTVTVSKPKWGSVKGVMKRDGWIVTVIWKRDGEFSHAFIDQPDGSFSMVSSQYRTKRIAQFLSDPQRTMST